MPETLSGIVDRVTFHSEESGFCVLKVRPKGARELATVVGRLPSVAPGEYLDASGAWVLDREHGRQFRADEMRVAPPSTRDGIEKYLGSGAIKGIGPRFAARLVEAFGEKLFEVIEKAPERLREVPGIGPERQSRLLKAWAEGRAVRDIMVFLHSHGVGTGRAVRIYKTYGQEAVDLVRRNPYRLASDIHGIGFRTADEVARRLGVDPRSQMRAEAGLAFVLEEMSRDGHCACPRGKLLEEAGRLLEIPAEVLERGLAARLAAGDVVESPIEGEPCLYLARLFQAESELADLLLRLRRGTHPLAGIPADKAIDWAQGQVGLSLAPSQREALRRAVASKTVVITGGPGVGKTTIVKALVRILAAKGLECRLCAPTGRAAKRLAETTGMPAQTIHRLLEFIPATGQFRHGREHPLRARVVVLDEASMVDVVLMSQLVRALPADACLVIVGDVDQLPSVGPGQVLRDILESGALPAVRLTELFRQAERSRIVESAHRINQGLEPVLEAPAGEIGDFFFISAAEEGAVLARVLALVKERIPQRFGLDPVRDIQVLVPMNRSSLGARALNAHLQAALNPPGKPEVARFGSTYRAGDKVMQIENNYVKEVFNGDLGFIRTVDAEAGEVAIEFDGREILYDLGELDEVVPAYATSVHKSQGCEYPAVVMPLHTQHYLMLQRNILYTAVTRARKLVVLVGSRKALGIALRTTGGLERLTGLRERLARGGS